MREACTTMYDSGPFAARVVALFLSSMNRALLLAIYILWVTTIGLSTQHCIVRIAISAVQLMLVVSFHIGTYPTGDVNAGVRSPDLLPRVYITLTTTFHRYRDLISVTNHHSRQRESCLTIMNDAVSISRATSVSRASSKHGSSMSRSQSLIKKNIAPHDLRPSDIMIERFIAWKAIVKQLIAYFEVSSSSIGCERLVRT